MAHYNFVKDFAQSKDGVDIAIKVLKDTYENVVIEEFDKEYQIYGDIMVCLDTDDGGKSIEVKYDMMAQKTGNLCFEISNGKKDTGIFKTKADEVWYIVPENFGHTIYIFDSDKLRHSLICSDFSNNFRRVTGGDKGKFVLMLATINFVKKALAKETIEVKNA